MGGVKDHAGLRLDSYGPHGSMRLPDDLVLLPPGPAEWMRDAACAKQLNLPWTVDHAQLDEYNRKILARICAGCPVRQACAAYADDHKVNAGFWAGTSRDRHPRDHHTTSITADGVDLLEVS